MNNRRGFLVGGVAGLAVIAGRSVAGQLALTGKASTTGTLRASVTWNPAVRRSGWTTMPTMGARGLGRARGKFWQKTRCRYTGGNFQVGVAAPKKYTDRVEFSLENGPIVAISTKTKVTRANLFYPSRTVSEPGYWATVDGSVMQAAITAALGPNGFGLATIVATIYDKRAGINPRIIYLDVAYNDHLDADFTYHFGTGQALATLDAALVQANAAHDNAKHPKFLNHTNGHVEMADSTGSNFGWESWGRLMDAPGVTSSWSRTTPIYYLGDGVTLFTQYWQIKADWLEFYKLSLDIKNISGVLAFSGGAFYRPSWLGCEIEDSGASNSLRATHARNLNPGILGYANNPGGLWWLQECGLKYLSAPCFGAQMANHNIILWPLSQFCTPSGNTNADEGDISTTFCAGNYVNSLEFPPEKPAKPVGSVTRATGGGLTTAWIEVTAPSGLGCTKVELFENGISIGNIVPGIYPGTTYYNIEDINAWIRGHSGWTAADQTATTVLNSGYLWATFYIAGEFPYNQTNRTDLGGGRIRLDVLGQVGMLGTSIDWHWEILKFPDVGACENVCVTSNQFNDIGDANTIKQPSETAALDFWFADNAISQRGVNGYQYDGGFGGDNAYCSGVTLAAKTTGGGWSLSSPTTSAYTQVSNFAGYVVSSDFTGSLSRTNSYFLVASSPTNLNTPPSSGNLSVTVVGTMSQLYTDVFNDGGSGFNWIPSDASFLANLVAQDEPWDGEGNDRSAFDLDGWISKNAITMQPVPAAYAVRQN